LPVLMAALLAGPVFLLGVVAFAVIFRGWSISSPESRDVLPSVVLPPSGPSDVASPHAAPQAAGLEARSASNMLDVVPGEPHPSSSRIRFSAEADNPFEVVSFLAPLQTGALSEIFTDYTVSIDAPSKRVYEISATRSYATSEHCLDARTRTKAEVIDAYGLELSEDGNSALGTSPFGAPISAEFWCLLRGASPYTQLTVRIAATEMVDVVRTRIDAAFPSDP